MPVRSLLPDAEGTQTAWGLGAGASKVVAVQSNDGDTSYITVTNAAEQLQTFYVDRLPDAATVPNVDVQIMVRNMGADWAKTYWRLSGTGVNGACEDPGGSYTQNYEAAIARPGGGIWAGADFPGSGAGTEVGVSSCNTGGSNEVRCTLARFLVTYTIPQGGNAWLLADWLPPILAVAGQALMNGEIAAILSRLKNRPSDFEDFSLIRAALRRRPAWQFQGIRGL